MSERAALYRYLPLSSTSAFFDPFALRYRSPNGLGRPFEPGLVDLPHPALGQDFTPAVASPAGMIYHEAFCACQRQFPATAPGAVHRAEAPPFLWNDSALRYRSPNGLEDYPGVDP
jgi:hypothetical protein